MIHYIVDNHEVNLDAETSIEFYSKNPFLTKEESFTLDIDIDLGDAHNAYVYGHCHRLEKQLPASARDAMLYDEKGVIIRGKEIILEVEKDKVKVQIAGGVSELNYRISGGLKMHSLHLGYIPGGNASTPRDDNVPGIATAVHGFVFDSEGILSKKLTPSPVLYEGKDEFVSGRNQFIYLWKTVERLVIALGYDMGRNYLYEHEKFRKIVIVGGSRTRYIEKRLPNWEVRTFISEVERLLAVSFQKNPASNTVDILPLSEIGQDGGLSPFVIEATDILGGIRKKALDEVPDEVSHMIYDDIAYDFPSTVYYKYEHIDAVVVSAHSDTSVIVPDSGIFTDDEKRYMFYIWRWINENCGTPDADWQTKIRADSTVAAYERYQNIFYDRATGRQYILLRGKPSIWADSYYQYYLQEVSKYGFNMQQDKSAMKIIPCEMVWVTGVDSALGSYNYYPFMWPMPVVVGSGNESKASDDEDREENDLITDIMKGIKEETVPDRIYIALEYGTVDCTWGDHWGRASESEMARRYLDAVCTSNAIVRPVLDRGLPDCRKAHLEYLGDSSLTLELDGEYGMKATEYADIVRFDAKTEYAVSFRSVVRPDPKSIFIIGNQRFLCKELKYSSNNCQFSEVVEGVFYKINENQG